MTKPRREHLCDLPLLEIAAKLQQREVSPTEVTQSVLDRVTDLDGRLNAFVTVLAERAQEAASRAEAEIAAGSYRGPLHGVPVSVKDLFATAGIRTTASSRILANHVPEEDATVVRRLTDAGAVLIGKTNMLEFAYAAVHPDFGPTPNPWNLDRSTSGSSSGSAAATAAGMGYASIGSDTGGSIRLPAAWCGIVGLKPTYGRISRHGGIALSWSCDHFGPMTRTVSDCAAVLGAVAGEDPRDSTSGRVSVPDYLVALEESVAGKRLGISDAYLRRNVDPEVQGLVEAAIKVLEQLGAVIKEVTLPSPSDAVAALLGILTPEATVYHLPWLRERPEDYSPAVRERLELGAITPAVSYIEAQRARRRITDEMLDVFDQVDLIAMPTSPTPATLLNQDLVTSDDADPELLATLINFTGPFDLIGLPAVSVPCGFTAGNLPVGMQLVGRPYDEANLLAVAHAYEQVNSWHQRLPTILAT